MSSRCDRRSGLPAGSEWLPTHSGAVLGARGRHARRLLVGLDEFHFTSSRRGHALPAAAAAPGGSVLELALLAVGAHACGGAGGQAENSRLAGAEARGKSRREPPEMDVLVHRLGRRRGWGPGSTAFERAALGRAMHRPPATRRMHGMSSMMNPARARLCNARVWLLGCDVKEQGGRERMLFARRVPVQA